ncbi:MAG TPA: hypothetical protein VK507_04120 [Iamia sp.]|nr:hypothetical protein [Iamia sp.]
MSDWDDYDDAGQAEAEHWEREDDLRHELAIAQHLEETEANETDRGRGQ